MKLTFKDGVQAEVTRLAFRDTYGNSRMQELEETLDKIRTECRKRMTDFRKDADLPSYVFLDPVRMDWAEGIGPKRWTDAEVLPLYHYTMRVHAGGKCLHLDWFDDAPTEGRSLDGMMQRAASVVEFEVYARPITH